MNRESLCRALQDVADAIKDPRRRHPLLVTTGDGVIDNELDEVMRALESAREAQEEEQEEACEASKKLLKQKYKNTKLKQKIRFLLNESQMLQNRISQELCCARDRLPVQYREEMDEQLDNVWSLLNGLVDDIIREE